MQKTTPTPSSDATGSRAARLLRAVDWTEIVCWILLVLAVMEGPDLAVALILSAIVAGGLERLVPFRPHNVFGITWRTDVFHAILSSALAVALAALVITYLGGGLRDLLVPHIGLILSQPLPIRLVETILLADLMMYGQHRLMHGVPWLWGFHQVHHSMEELNWLAAYRVHPVDKALVSVFAFMPFYVLGTWNWPIAIAVFSTFEAINTPWAHGNLNISLGPLWWVVRNPEFHRWHHSRSRRAMNSNFSQTFPIWDIIFRTKYMPRDHAPQEFGLPEPLSPRYLDQLMVPFAPKERVA